MKIFDNCLIQAPDGVPLSRCGLKKAFWYLDRNLAHLVEEEPFTIRLNFEPSGRNGINDPLLIMGKPNVCVVCGTDQHLTRHHIIPYCFIKHMPVEYKVDIIRDIFPLCKTCHHDYEHRSMGKRREIIARELGIDRHLLAHKKQMNQRHAGGAAKALLQWADKIPPHRQEYLKDILREYCGVKEFDKETLEQIVHDNDKMKWDNFSKEVVSRLKDLDVFAQEWREHFIATMDPKYMPVEWTTDRKLDLEAIWIPERIRTQPHDCAIEYPLPPA